MTSRPTDGALLDLVDAGRGCPAAVRALLLLPPEAEAWSIGSRDRALLRSRAEWFGARWELRAECPACSEALELPLDAAAMGATLAESPVPGEMDVGDARIRWRAPTAGEFARASLAADLLVAEATLLDACVSGTDPRQLPDELRVRILDAIAAADPDALTLLDLECPSCAHRWAEPLDVPGALWQEIERSVELLLEDVAVLAEGYGWTESDVLALPRWRRRHYVESLDR